ncbi:MAG: hypothetical protein O2992_13805 [Gemmatimonadetes bacterium]|nr:hypothetical protein [Gemmatimonadota bacterium]
MIRFTWTLVLGLFLGGLLTKLAEIFLPESPARDFLTTAVYASLGPLDVNLVAMAFSLGPITITVNVLTLLGVSIVALIMRSWI